MSAPDRNVQLSRMEAARRQTQHQLFIIDRQIMRNMNLMVPQLRRKRSPFHQGKASDPRSFVERYRSNLAALTAERQSEIDALAASWRVRMRQSPCCAPSRRRVRAVQPEAGLDQRLRTNSVRST